MVIVAEGVGPRKHQLAEGEGQRRENVQLSLILAGTSRGQ